MVAMAGDMRSLGDVRHGAVRPFVLARWLFLVAALIAAIVVIGGITRLTESGLSIVHWNPIGGMIPPHTAAQWQAMFAAYQASPQGRLVNGGMDLAAFKGIFFWEYLHRLAGRHGLIRDRILPTGLMIRLTICLLTKYL